MKYTNLFMLLVGADIINASPLDWMWQKSRRQVETDMNDVDILNYALTLEHLEATFYREGLQNFSKSDFKAAGYDRTFYKNVQTIAAHEAAHVQFLTTALQSVKAKPVAECTYAFGITSVDQFVATAAIFEGIGTSAYLGAAKQIANKAYLTAAGSILTVEARHNAYLRSILSESPFPQSQEDPLSPDEVHTMAHGFIVSCPPGNPTFPVKAFPSLSVLTTGTISPGDEIMVSTGDVALTAADKGAHLTAAFITANGPIWTTMKARRRGNKYKVKVPEGINGQSYLLFNDCNTVVTDDTVVAGPTFIEISAVKRGRKNQ